MPDVLENVRRNIVALDIEQDTFICREVSLYEQASVSGEVEDAEANRDINGCEEARTSWT